MWVTRTGRACQGEISGRTAFLDLAPFRWDEAMSSRGAGGLTALWFRGGFPRAFLEPVAPVPLVLLGQVLFEVKLHSSPRMDDARGLVKCMETLRSRHGYLVYPGPERDSLGRGVTALPAGPLLAHPEGVPPLRADERGRGTVCRTSGGPHRLVLVDGLPILTGHKNDVILMPGTGWDGWGCRLSVRQGISNANRGPG